MVEGGAEAGAQRRAGCGWAGRSGRVLGGGPAPESTGAWSQAGASGVHRGLESGWGLCLHRAVAQSPHWGLGPGGWGAGTKTCIS